MTNSTIELGRILKQQRVAVSLTLRELTEKSGVSASHLGRIERGERFPSAHILKRIASPLGFEEEELLTLAGYLSPQPSRTAEEATGYAGKLDPYVARVLSQESVDVQRAILGMLAILKSIARSEVREKP